MKVFMHKETGELALCRKVWLEAGVPFNVEYSIQFETTADAIAFENKHGVIFILPPKVLESFEEIGEL